MMAVIAGRRRSQGTVLGASVLKLASVRSRLLPSTRRMATAPTTAFPLELLNETIGAIEIGGMIACLLMGIVAIQSYFYFSNYPDDHIGTKVLVAIICICELGHSVCISHLIYISTVTSWSNPLVLIAPPKTLPIAILFSSLTTTLVQKFLAYRIKGVANAWILTAICWSLSLARMAFALVALVQGVRMVTFVQYIRDWKWSIMATIVIGSANDVLIALSLVWVLLQQRQWMSARSSLVIVDTLVLWTLQTGLLTSMGWVLMMILFLTMPNNYIWLAVFTFLAKLYSNSLLAVLNGREFLREKGGTVVELYPTSNFSGTTTLNERLRNVNSAHIESQIEFAGKSVPAESLPAKLEHNDPVIHISREVVTSH